MSDEDKRAGPGWRRLGQTLVRWGGSESAQEHEHLLDLSPARDRLTAWWSAGGLAGLRSILPFADRPREKLGALELLSAGPGGALPALAALAFGVGTVRAIVGPQDLPACNAVAASMNAEGRLRCLARAADAPEAVHHVALLGTGSRSPQAGDYRDVVRSLRPEGQLTFFGLPEDEVTPLFRELAEKGFSLRASGTLEDLAYLSGSLLHRERFLS